ncbi:aminotransferase class V-fold PLP-dependent enzyme [Brevibacillus agri]|uniref:aminotransferase class V-fold PLP-dependent enzyme n=1 Tax=Brevibacillus agri TaxID=51101 RepID=UPI002E1DE7C1|nr:aminotransferase class V-fold PLP-dependent enzyme [Brevibacillus agri]MED1655478.1 aminotransferase class V-fold PLP-dependent enzyme [Brevibacillus agri]MED1687382.1 aminotransferase class V-fold PLP-dependent enzyme [Brevibacillus agri]MED1692051.1 aminotransferase class V-fold PLP-dependent enzyme [Brevibacillus agri]MED1697957.1 aminotransferase class V-fold PLP-dependent enzyme [Brevibacillus agri]
MTYTYLNTAAASVPPQQVVDTMVAYLQKTATVGPYLPAFRRDIYAKVDAIRETAAAFIGAAREEIAFAKNGTEGINMIASGIRWHEGDEVILADLEFHSNYVPWKRLAEQGKIKLVVLRTDASGVISIRQLEQLITPRTRLITVSHLPNASGALQPIQEICDMASRKGILTLVNASQTLGLVPLDMRALPCDFLVACGRKWLRGPEGSGIVFIRKAQIESITPTFAGWGGTTWDFQTNEISFLSTAKRLEAGCPIIPSILGLGTALEVAQEAGVAAIYRRVKHLTSFTLEKLRTIPGVEIYGPQDETDRLAIIPFNIKGVSPDAITAFLEQHAVIIEAGTFMANTLLQQYGIERMARISPHYFNTEQEIERAIALIRLMLAEA